LCDVATASALPGGSRKPGNGWCYFPSVGTEIKCNNSLFFRPYGQKFIRIYTLFSVHMDGNLQLNFAIFRPYEQMAPHYCPK